MLVDTHVLLWIVTGSDRLGQAARERLRGAEKVWYSAASVWELRLKESLGKIELPDQFLDSVGEAGLVALPIRSDHADAIRRIVLPHKDPFDRLLVAQSMVEKIPFLTSDRHILGATTVEGAALVDARR